MEQKGRAESAAPFYSAGSLYTVNILETDSGFKQRANPAGILVDDAMSNRAAKGLPARLFGHRLQKNILKGFVRAGLKIEKWTGIS